MIKSRKIRYFEIGLYIFIGLIATGVPLFMHYGEEEEWTCIFREWARLLPFLFIFLINNFILAPRFLLRSKYISYIISSLLLLVAVASFNSLIRFSSQESNTFTPNREITESHKKPPHFPEEKKDRFTSDNRNKPIPPPKPDTLPLPPKGPFPPYFPYFSFAIFLVGFLILGFNSGVKIFIQWMDDKEVRGERERQHLSTELAFLKHQVSPHFFMNTLNNIHALIDIDSEKAKNAVIKLSRLMRYLLYESNTEKVSLKKEIEFLESYIELMRLRYNENNISVSISYPKDNTDIHIPALLFLPLIENAFKHGIIPGKKSFVTIDFRKTDEKLVLHVKNSNFPLEIHRLDETSGIGLENIKKRLDLIYKNNYTLQINSSEAAV